jgi:hypothetical protein
MRIDADVVAFGSIVAVVALVGGSIVYDRAKATPQVAEVLIVDKDYRPGHYDTHCSTDGHGHLHCYQSWVPPSWVVEYADEERWRTTVSQVTFDALHVGDKKVLRYARGGGWWHARYDERFVLTPLAPEAAWPAR